MSMLYSGGLVFDGVRMHSDWGVLVEGRLIRRAAAMAEFAGYDGPRTDTAGATLLPGLIDTHMHLLLTAGPDQLGPLMTLSAAQLALGALKNAQSALAGGITSIRDVGGKDFIEMAVRDAINRGDFVGPTILCAGHIIVMTGGHAWKIGREADGVDDVVRAVREQLKGGADLIKLMATGGVSSSGSDPSAPELTFEELAAAIGEATRRGKRTAAHAHGRGGVLNAIKAGITSIEHGIFIDDECIEAMIAAGTFLVPTLSVGHWTAQNAHRGTIAPHVVEKSLWATEIRRSNFKRFVQAGGKVAMGTDCGTQYNFHGMSAYELVLMVDAGQSPIQALTSATSLAAELMGLADRGRIADGLLADLLVVDGDPSADIANVGLGERHRLVIKDGSVVKWRST